MPSKIPLIVRSYAQIPQASEGSANLENPENITEENEICTSPKSQDEEDMNDRDPEF